MGSNPTIGEIISTKICRKVFVSPFFFEKKIEKNYFLLQCQDVYKEALISLMDISNFTISKQTKNFF